MNIILEKFKGYYAHYNRIVMNTQLTYLCITDGSSAMNT
jgi:hypothetical protein